MENKGSDYVISVKNLSKRFDNYWAVSDFSLNVRPGEIFGFLGPNGAGKTTTIRMLCGLLTPDSGTGFCLGYDIINEFSLIRHHVGYIPQFFSLYKQLTVYENIMLAAELYGVSHRKEKVGQIMERLDLSSRKNQLSGLLSGGWKQRLALAAALIHQPRLLILDEPTASIDSESRRNFWEIMYDLSTEGITIFLSSHNMDEIEHCHRIAYLDEGKLLLEGTIKDIRNNLHLTTWRVRGPNVFLLAKQLETSPQIEQVIIQANNLHVTGKDEELLASAIKSYRENPDFSWEQIETTLDDIFAWITKNKAKES